MSALEKLTPPQSPKGAAGRVGGSAGRKSGSAEPTLGDIFAMLTSMQEGQGQMTKRLAVLEAKDAASEDAAEKRKTLAAAMATLKYPPESKTPKSKTPKPDRVLDLVRESVADRQRTAGDIDSRSRSARVPLLPVLHLWGARRFLPVVSLQWILLTKRMKLSRAEAVLGCPNQPATIPPFVLGFARTCTRLWVRGFVP